jgi:hypothetical protein
MVSVVAIAFNDSPKGVLEQLKADVGQMTRNVGEIEVLGADKLDWRTFEHSVVLFAHITSIFDGLLKDIMDVLIPTW